MANRRIKVLYLIPALVQGGAERQILELMRGVDPERFETTLCVFTTRDRHYDALLPPGEPKHVIDADRADPAAIWRFVEVLRSEKPDIVHSYMDRANLFARVAAQFAGRPIVVTSVRGPLMQLRFMVLERALSSLGAKIITNSRGIERELTGWARVPAERIEVIPNIVNLDRFGPSDLEERMRARRQWGVEEETAPVAAFVGWIGIAKFHLGYVHALSLLRKKGGLPPGFVTLCAGRTRDSLPARLLPPWIRWCGVEDLLRFLGPVREIRSVYAAADFTVLPSLYEGLSNALLESMASGLPVVVSEGANRDGFVEDGVSGFVFRTGRTASLASALERMLKTSPQQRRAMGMRARAKILNELPADRPIEAIVSLYEDELRKKNLT